LVYIVNNYGYHYVDIMYNVYNIIVRFITILLDDIHSHFFNKLKFVIGSSDIHVANRYSCQNKLTVEIELND